MRNPFLASRQPYLKKAGPIAPAPGKPHIVDDYALTLLMAVNVSHLRPEPDLTAIEALLTELFTLERRLTLDHYYAPFGHAEMARVHMNRQQWALARKEITFLKANFRHYSNEPQLQMRLHVMLQELDEREKSARS